MNSRPSKKKKTDAYGDPWMPLDKAYPLQPQAKTREQRENQIYIARKEADRILKEIESGCRNADAGSTGTDPEIARYLQCGPKYRRDGERFVKE